MLPMYMLHSQSQLRKVNERILSALKEMELPRRLNSLDYSRRQLSQCPSNSPHTHMNICYRCHLHHLLALCKERLHSLRKCLLVPLILRFPVLHLRLI